MGQPKKRTTPRRTGARRSHHVVKLAKRVNATSPVRVYTTRREKTRQAEAKPAAKKSKAE